MKSTDRVDAVLSQLDQGREPYYQQHRSRYAATLEALLRMRCRGGAALEIGYTDLFLFLLGADLEMRAVYGTEFRADNEAVESRRHTVTADGTTIDATIVRVNIEDEPLPLPDAMFDLVMCSEVLEHMDVDPMYALAEFNRVLKPGGHLFVSTPNSTSYAMVAKVIEGYRPHFYMQYHRDRNRYRHNFEHDCHSLLTLTRAAGFETEELDTYDVFEPPHPVGIEYCRRFGFSHRFRGDCLFYIGRKVGGVVDRHPAGVYV